MADNQRQVRDLPVAPGASAAPAAIPRLFGPALLAEAVTLGIASYLHRDGRIPLGVTVIHGEWFPAASIPEAIIGAVLTAGAAIVLAAPARARRTAVFATGFAIFGFVVGTVFVLASGRPDITADLTYHAAGLTALVTTLVMLVLGRPHRSASGRAAWRQRVRSR
jgi:heme A synthase